MSVEWTGMKNGEKIPLGIGDTISIEVLRKMRIDGQNNARYTGYDFTRTVLPGDMLTGQVTRIGETLEISMDAEHYGEDLYYFPIQEKENLKIEILVKYVPPPPPPPPTEEEIAAKAAKEKHREAVNKERAEILAADQKLKREQQQQEKVRQEETEKLGPWNVITNNGNSRPLNLGDTISIEVLQKMKIDGQNTGRWSSHDFTRTVLPGDMLTGQVTMIGETLEISIAAAHEAHGEDLYYFPIQEKENLEIVLQEVSPNDPQKVSPNDLQEVSPNDPQKVFPNNPQEVSPNDPQKKVLTKKEFIQKYQPSKKSPDEICQLIKNYPTIYKELHDNRVLPKKIDIEGKQFKKQSNYKCNNGNAYFASVLSRAFGSKSKGGNKKSRKIYKKKTKNRTKTKKKKSRTSIKTHKLKKTSRRSRKNKN